MNKDKPKIQRRQPTNIHVCWYGVNTKDYCGAKAELCLFDKDDGFIPIKYYCDKHFIELLKNPSHNGYNQATEASE